MLSPEFPCFFALKSPGATRLQLRGRIKGTGCLGLLGPNFGLFNSLLPAAHNLLLQLWLCSLGAQVAGRCDLGSILEGSEIHLEISHKQKIRTRLEPLPPQCGRTISGPSGR